MDFIEIEYYLPQRARVDHVVIDMPDGPPEYKRIDDGYYELAPPPYGQCCYEKLHKLALILVLIYMIFGMMMGSPIAVTESWFAYLILESIYNAMKWTETRDSGLKQYLRCCFNGTLMVMLYKTLSIMYNTTGLIESRI